MAALSQENRYFHFDNPLGPDKLLIAEFQWEEKISKLFKGNVVLVSEDFDIDPADILQRNVSAGVQRIDGSFRWFNGHVSVFRQIHRPGRLAYYEAEIVPWLWFLTLTSDCYIHQDLTVPKIIEWIFQAYDFADFDMSKLTGSHEELKYCCQYRETAFEFVSRLMESEGIYYFRSEEHTSELQSH